MTTIEATATSAQEPLSLKAACVGFIASTAFMTLVMVLVGNLIQ